MWGKWSPTIWHNLQAGRAGAAPLTALPDWRTLVGRELPGSRARQREPCTQTLSSVWIWAARPIFPVAQTCNYPTGTRSVQESLYCWDPTTGRMDHRGCFVSGLRLKGRTCLAKGVCINPTCTPAAVIDGLGVWITRVCEGKWCCSLVQQNRKQEMPFGAPSPFERHPWSRRYCAQKLSSFLEVLFFSQLKTVLVFCREYWFVCFGIQWEFQFLHVPWRPLKVQRLPGFVFRAIQWTQQPKPPLWNCYQCYCQGKGCLSGISRQHRRCGTPQEQLMGNLGVWRLLLTGFARSFGQGKADTLHLHLLAPSWKTFTVVLIELRIKSISSAFGRKAESAFSVAMFRTCLISYPRFLEHFALCIHKENRLCYSFVIKMQLKTIDLKKNQYRGKETLLLVSSRSWE